MTNTENAVSVWEETVTIPTYPAGMPGKNPMFLDKRVYQGSSGAVYPYPVIETIEKSKIDKEYQAIFLENRYIKIMLLPEPGGRVQMALDKTNGEHFVYYNRVIKPALVGLTGPWISGGIEFNWPQHHRPGTFSPVHYEISEDEQGVKTVWFSEIERMNYTKGMAGFTLYPDRAYLEISVKLYNRTSIPQTFLWWANPAVHVSDDYQSIFPPDVYAVMDHGKRDVSRFPIADGVYYKVDYSPGTDISRYKNVPVPTSYMAFHSDYDFLGYYDHGKRAGMIHVANHHHVPGKKQWTWGNGDFGKSWDRLLTDEDGPYIELMCGAFTDNQPDFSWLQPGEEKQFTQIFMPFKDIGGAKNATKDVIVNLEVTEGQARIGVYSSRPLEAQIQLSHDGIKLLDESATLSPEITFTQNILLPQGLDESRLELLVLEHHQAIITYKPPIIDESDFPEPAQAALPPDEIQSVDELFLNGLHLEQYRHATYNPEQYYQEALRRDPDDYRCNNALGLLSLRRGQLDEAEAYFRRAIRRLMMRNGNPYDAEAIYNLGLVLTLQGNFDGAYDRFYKATWNHAWQSSCYFELGCISARRGKFDEALSLARQALLTNQLHHSARHLVCICLRQMGLHDEALQTLNEALQTLNEALQYDPLHLSLLYEKALLTGDFSQIEKIINDRDLYIEIALDYYHAGLLSDALDVLSHAPESNPLTHYYGGWVCVQLDKQNEAKKLFSLARQCSPDYCYPNRVEATLALKMALQHHPQDARAYYYLGNFWYAHRCYDDALHCWEQATTLDNQYPTAFRNFGFATMNIRGDAVQAQRLYQQAFELDLDDARVLFCLTSEPVGQCSGVN